MLTVVLLTCFEKAQLVSSPPPHCPVEEAFPSTFRCPESFNHPCCPPPHTFSDVPTPMPFLTLFGAGGGLLGPLRFFLCHCQTPQNRKLILGDFFETFIAHILTKQIIGSGQVRSPEAFCWPHLRKVCNHARASIFHGSIYALQVFISVPSCTICLSQNLYICELRSGQIRDLYITSLWENIEMRPTSSK